MKFKEEQWVITYCDNIAARVDCDVKEIFGNGKVYFSACNEPRLSNQVMPAMTGQLNVVLVMDRWLMDTSNLEN